MYKQILLIIALAAGLIACDSTTRSTPEIVKTGSGQVVRGADTADLNNNFYDNVETYSLPGGEILVTGEIENPGMADLSALPTRSVITKETLLNEEGGNTFIGAYRYGGYSLFDILADRILDKKNKEEFPPIIDLYVEIENDKGEKVVLSWGEIYYPNILNQILIAADGYRSIYSLSEIVNRNDQADILLVPVAPGKDGGLFRLFPSCDFFSDRAVKAISTIDVLE
ncbi:MAG: hypothetical protein ABIJ04_09415 [Bacteroidota bacterium]